MCYVYVFHVFVLLSTIIFLKHTVERTDNAYFTFSVISLLHLKNLVYFSFVNLIVFLRKSEKMP
jgi:hypothetical protein